MGISSWVALPALEGEDCSAALIMCCVKNQGLGRVQGGDQLGESVEVSEEASLKEEDLKEMDLGSQGEREFVGEEGCR